MFERKKKEYNKAKKQRLQILNINTYNIVFHTAKQIIGNYINKWMMYQSTCHECFGGLVLLTTDAFGKSHEVLIPVNNPSNLISIVSNVVIQLQLVPSFSYLSLFPTVSISTEVIVGYSSLRSHHARSSFVFSLYKNKLFHHYHFLLSQNF